MGYSLSPLGGAGWQFFDNNGLPLAGGMLYSYQAGTSTLQSTYTSSSGSIQNSNPIILDSSGRPSNEIWFNNSLNYKLVLTDANGVQIWSMDNIGNGILTIQDVQNISKIESYQTASANQTLFTGLNYIVGNNNINVYVNGSKQIVGLNYTETSSTSITFVSGLNSGDIVEFVIG